MNETTSGAPLTATVGERVGADPHVEEAREAARRTGERRGARRARPYPWAALAIAAVGWALLAGIAGRLRARGRRVARGLRRIAS